MKARLIARHWLATAARAIWAPDACRLCARPVRGRSVHVRGPQGDKPPALPTHFLDLSSNLCGSCLAFYASPAAIRPQPVDLLPDTPRLRGWIGPYDATARQLVHDLKYRQRLELASVLGGLLALTMAAPWQGPRLIVPIPLHREREQERGFNQAALIASTVANRLIWPLAPVLHRTAPTSPQAGLSRGQRQANLAEAFHLTTPVNDRHILLVDDVCTTGATLAAAADVCRAGGAAAVTAAVLFVVQPDDM